ncbi:MAG: hypothetical protein IRY95_01675 [Clostridia bacterium]|nr:hypothetical protein [Clostridia bacterium]
MEVIALVGPAGTGKSHRASLVAYEVGAATIVDDGLLIQNGKILAGASAKAERSALAAVRRAIFVDPEQREAVRRKLLEIAPERVLVLGTSEAMVERIAAALGLPPPSRIIDIAEVASPQEIRRARRARRIEGKHVIPAPTVEVKKSLSGLLVDPLRLFFRTRSRGQRELVFEKSTVRPTFSSLGRFYVADTVVSAIAVHAAARVPGVAHVSRLAVDIGEASVTVTLDVVAREGVPLLPVLRQAQERARDTVETMTSLATRVDVVARRLAPPAAEEVDGTHRA